MRGALLHTSIACALLTATLAGAQSYPNKPIRIIVPYPPGAGTEFTAREVAQLFTKALGQQVVPIETPVFEFKDVLLTKSGGETEKQVYFVQSTGALAQDKTPELALRFDLTVPLARYVAEHERDLAFPFRSYQIQRVYRGERAQRGRVS